MVILHSEIDRIRKVYRLREEKGIDWSLFRPEVHFMYFELQREYLKAFKLCGVDEKNISQKKLLDAGCNEGKPLRWFQDLGFKHLYGIDVLDWKISSAQKINPSINFLVGDISHLPFKSSYFDFVILAQVFSSILDETMIKESALELYRALAPGGAIIIDDMSRSELVDRQFRYVCLPKYLHHINGNELKKLFPEARISYWPCLVSPFLTGAFTSIINRGFWRSIFRRIPFVKNAFPEKKVVMIKFPYCLAEIMKHFSFFNIHIFAIIRKQK